MALTVLAGFASAVFAEEPAAVSPILVIESDRMYTESLFGQRVSAELARLQADLIAQNAKMEESLTQEERDLTEKRKVMAADAFEVLAREFDDRVVGIRAEQDAKFARLADVNERERAVFIQAARPILSELMAEAGAAIILERRTVLVSNDSIDITQEAIRRLNSTLGEGRQVPTPQE
ncbi:OmpH family outer membrane protein [Shimia haliotis]|nr:OmpH family outer membrane protein [Shimia haliotis]